MKAAVALSERASALALDVSVVRGAVEGGREMSVAFATPGVFASPVDWGRSLSSRTLLVRGGSAVIALARSSSGSGRLGRAGGVESGEAGVLLSV